MISTDLVHGDAAFVMIRVGDKYSARYVEKLAGGLRRHCSWDLPIYCITDQPEETEVAGVIPVPAAVDLPGWWQKIDLFRPRRGLPRHLVFCDLDVVILGSLDPVLDEYLGQHEFSYSLDLVDRVSSSLFLLDTHSNFARDVYEGFDFQNFEQRFPGGDQKYLDAFIDPSRYDVAGLPDRIHYSYKYLIGDPSGYGENRNAAIGPVDVTDVISLNFHGRPKPDCIEEEPHRWPHAELILRNW